MKSPLPKFAVALLAVWASLPLASAATTTPPAPHLHRIYSKTIKIPKTIPAPQPYNLATDAAPIAKNGGHSTTAQVGTAIVAASRTFKIPPQMAASTTRTYSDALQHKGIKQDMVPVLQGLVAYVPKVSHGADFYTAMDQYFRARFAGKSHAAALLAAKKSCAR